MSDVLRIVHLVPAMEQGGVETVVCDLNRALVQAGRESIVLSCGGRLVAQIEAEGGRHFALDLKSKNPLTYLPRMLRLRRVLRELAAEKPLLVCAHSRVPAWLFVGANRTLKLPWITYAHGANSVSRYSAVMTKGDLVVTPSHFLADYLLANYPTLAASRVRVIHPALDFVRFDPAKITSARVEVLRRAWGIRAGERVVMSIGRLTPVKGFDAVMRQFADENRPGTLVIVGGAEKRHAAYAEELRARARALTPEGAPFRIVFAGPQADIPACLAVADEVVSGNVTKPESFGLSVAEALAMNKPVRLLRSFGGAAEILASVAAARKPTLREGIRTLCDFDIMSQKTREIYDSL